MGTGLQARRIVAAKPTSVTIPFGETTRAAKGATIVAALVALYLIWGSAFLCVKIALTAFPPMLLNGIRLLVPGTMMYAALRFRGEPNPTRSQWRGIVVIGGFLMIGGYTMLVVAQQWVDSGMAAVMIATSPLWTALLGGLVEEWPTRATWAGLAMGFTGVALLQSQSTMRAHPLGAVLLILSSVCWAIGTITGRHVSLPSVMMSSATEMMFGGLVMLFCAAILKELPAIPSAAAWGSLFYLTFISSLVGFTLFMYLMLHTTPTLAVSYTFVTPVIGVALGHYG